MKRIFILLMVLVSLVGCALMSDRISVASNFLPSPNKIITTNASDEKFLMIVETDQTKRVILYPGGDISFGILVWRSNYTSYSLATVTIKEIEIPYGRVWSETYRFYYNEKKYVRIIIRKGFDILATSSGY